MIANKDIYEIYKNRLLDFSGRNKAICFKMTKNKSLDLFATFGITTEELLEKGEVSVKVDDLIEPYLVEAKEAYEKELVEYKKEQEDYEAAMYAYHRKKVAYENLLAEYEKEYEKYELALNEYSGLLRQYQIDYAHYLEVMEAQFGENKSGRISLLKCPVKPIEPKNYLTRPTFDIPCPEMPEEPTFNTEEAEFKAREEYNEKRKVLDKILTESSNFTKETGSNGLYLTYYFISYGLKGYNTLNMYAPIYLIPITIDIKPRVIVFKCDKEEAVLNRAMLIALFKVMQKTVNFKLFDGDGTTISRESINNFIHNLYELNLDIKEDEGAKRFPSNLHNVNYGEMEIHDHSVITHLPLATSLYDDYDRLNGDTNTSVDNLIQQHKASQAQQIEISNEYKSFNVSQRYIKTITKLDTSQELAVYMAKKSDNLVIYGPPGTGKSETILNIISDSLSQGKRILVVSEKKTAISVLYNRLGLLKKLSLFLHSDALKLKEIKAQMQESLNYQFELDNTTNSNEILNQIEEAYSYFDTIYNTLSKNYRGLSISEWYSEIASLNFEKQSRETLYKILRDPYFSELLKYDYNNFKFHIDVLKDKERLELYKELNLSAKEYEVYNRLLSNSLNIFEILNELYNIKENVDKINKYAKLSKECDSLVIDVNRLDGNIRTKEQDSKYLENLISEAESKKKTLEETKGDFETVLFLVKNINDENFNALSSNEHLVFLGDVWKLKDLIDAFISNYRTLYYYNRKFFLFRRKKIQEALQEELDKSAKSLSDALTGKIKEIEESISEETKKLNPLYDTRNKLSGEISLLNEEKSDKNTELETICTEKDTLKEYVDRLPTDNIKALFGESYSSNKAELASYVTEFINSLNKYDDNRNKYFSFAQYDNSITTWIPKLYSKVSELSKSFNLSFDFTVSIIEACYYTKILEEIEGDNYWTIKKIDSYKDYQEKCINNGKDLLEANCDEIFKNVRGSAYRSIYCDAEIEKLYDKFIKEVGKNSRKIKTKQFMEIFLDLILRLFPVVLATPSAVSRYLPLQKDKFDLVVFDEASQLLIEKAIPSIYRARKVVVVGDDKQLKPSRYFKGSLSLEDEIGMVTDEYEDRSDEEISLFAPDAITEDSLLDTAKTLYSSVSLMYHYRSIFAELIGFSNAAFYNGRLKLAPNVNKDLLGQAITRIKVNGLWENNQNIEEADRVVDLVKELLINRKHGETIGVITFNKKQQDCIQSRLIEETYKDDEFKVLLDKERSRIEDEEDKSLFVKNIENVQGDERDIIIFSVGYARNSRGKLYTNFGPLSGDGGENRLNVAISRAKRHIYLVTSFEPDELVVDNSLNAGPKYFKDYLKYAYYVSQGNQEMVASIIGKYIGDKKTIDEVKFDSPFEEQVYIALKDRGLEVDTQIGCFGFRIDLGIFDKEMHKYILGIECDGATYHSSTSARERDIERQAFLNSCGWNIYRIWSTKWWQDSKSIVDDICRVVDGIRNTYKEKIGATVEETVEETLIFDTPNIVSGHEITEKRIIKELQVTEEINSVEEGQFMEQLPKTIAIIDVETSFSNNLMSVGVVIADKESFEYISGFYGIIVPKEYGMFSDAIYKFRVDKSKFNVKELNRESCLAHVKEVLEENNVEYILGYNSGFDYRCLPELQEYKWIDIAKVAAYKTYNQFIPPQVEASKTGRIKKWSMEVVMQNTNRRSYMELHNAFQDAYDELLLVQAVKQPISLYERVALLKK